MRHLLILLLPVLMALAACNYKDEPATDKALPVWPAEKALEWQKKHGWLVGCNYIPATAINQLEMWQADTFDPETIDKELGWASGIGFNFVRVFLHDLLWEADSTGFAQRMDTFLQICKKHDIKVMFVLFDDCWYGNAQLGKQPDPVPGLHNSGWLQSPTFAAVMDTTQWPRLERYTKGILSHYKDNEQVIIWDLYNEPANNHFPEQIFPLVKKVFAWAREVNPSQPLTVCAWKRNESTLALTDYSLTNSDVISFHNYGDYEAMAKDIANFKSYGRPVICTEYLARGNKSLFETHLPLLRKHDVGAVNWGLVDGKTQTKYHWNHPLNVIEIEPWHHEVFHTDGRPYSEAEVQSIRQVTGR